jgi:hypothetical protein
MRKIFKEGDLIEVGRHNQSWTLCLSAKGDLPYVRECPVAELSVYIDPRYDNIFICLEGKVGLIVYVARNLLNQSVGYRVLIEEHEVFFKAIVAEKYFTLVETRGDESR